MVLFGLDPLIVTYREVNAYEHLLDAAVVHDADQMSIEQLHEMAWPLVEQRLRRDPRSGDRPLPQSEQHRSSVQRLGGGVPGRD